MTVVPLKRTLGQSLSKQLDEVLIMSHKEMVDEETQVAHHPQTVLFVGSGALLPQILPITVYATPATQCLTALYPNPPLLEARLIINISHYCLLPLSLCTYISHTYTKQNKKPAYMCSYIVTLKPNLYTACMHAHTCPSHTWCYRSHNLLNFTSVFVFCFLVYQQLTSLSA